MRLRPAQQRDAAAVLALDVTAFGPDAWSQAGVVEELTGPGRTAVVALDPDVVGFAVTRSAGDVVDLQRIVVAGSHRRRGLARRLLSAVTDPSARLLLEVSERNDAAIAFYRAEGFAEIDRRRRYYRDSSDALVMQRPPAPGSP